MSWGAPSPSSSRNASRAKVRQRRSDRGETTLRGRHGRARGRPASRLRRPVARPDPRRPQVERSRGSPPGSTVKSTPAMLGSSIRITTAAMARLLLVDASEPAIRAWRRIPQRRPHPSHRVLGATCVDVEVRLVLAGERRRAESSAVADERTATVPLRRHFGDDSIDRIGNLARKRHRQEHLVDMQRAPLRARRVVARVRSRSASRNVEIVGSAANARYEPVVTTPVGGTGARSATSRSSAAPLPPATDVWIPAPVSRRPSARFIERRPAGRRSPHAAARPLGWSAHQETRP